MALWVVRAGRRGERESLALEKGVAVIGWDALPDLSTIASRSELKELLRRHYPDAKEKRLINWAGQVWTFVKVVRNGDLIALPLKSRSAIAVGRVKDGYRYQHELPPDARHARSVEWLGEYPRSRFDQDLLMSLGSSLTVCRIERNNAEERMWALISGRASPAASADQDEESAPTESQSFPDLEEFARDQIRSHITRKFTGHGLSALVGAILEAQGYTVRVAPEGPDGGVDIIAGKGLLGFDPPKLVVQVKSGDMAADVKVLRELRGTMKSFSADQGLFVSWGGYKSSVTKEFSRAWFEIRLWDSGDVVRMLQAHYDQLPDLLQAELPLKRIWTLVLSDEDDE